MELNMKDSAVEEPGFYPRVSSDNGSDRDTSETLSDVDSSELNSDSSSGLEQTELDYASACDALGRLLEEGNKADVPNEVTTVQEHLRHFFHKTFQLQHKIKKLKAHTKKKELEV